VKATRTIFFFLFSFQLPCFYQ